MKSYDYLIGEKMEGYCRGYFGRDSYGEKIIEAIGKDWVVIRENVYINNSHEPVRWPNLAHFENETQEDMIAKIEKWVNEYKEKYDLE